VNGYLAEVRRRRDLVTYLVVAGLKAQHRNTFLGYFWWLLDPLLGALIYYFVVVVVFRGGGPDYGAHLIVGLIVWRWLSASIASASGAIVNQAALITQVYLPKVVFPLTTTLTGLVNFGFGLVVVAILLLVWGMRVGSAVLWLPVVVATQTVFILMISAVVAYVCVFLRDLDTLIGHAMRLWFYGTPVIWTRDMIPERLHWAIQLNPMAVLLTDYRTILIDNQRPDLLPLAGLAAASLAATVLMTYLYSQYEHRIVKAL
jgi:lipopolysaccharide transport system permease protein/teichoic acid transport system permease protein